MRAKVTEDQGLLQQPQTGRVLHADPRSVKAQLWDLWSSPGGSRAPSHREPGSGRRFPSAEEQCALAPGGAETQL